MKTVTIDTMERFAVRHDFDVRDLDESSIGKEYKDQYDLMKLLGCKIDEYGSVELAW